MIIGGGVSLSLSQLTSFLILTPVLLKRGIRVDIWLFGNQPRSPIKFFKRVFHWFDFSLFMVSKRASLDLTIMLR